MARLRYVCPAGVHRGVIAPSRMRRDDPRRYCPDCTAELGMRTERISPARERARAEKIVRDRKKRDGIKFAQTADGMDIRREWERLKALSCWKQWGVRGTINRTAIQVHGGSGKHSSGRYNLMARRVHVTAGSAPGWAVSKTLLHELMHAAQHGRREQVRNYQHTRWHDELFHRMLATAAQEAYDLTTDEMGEVRRIYQEQGGARRAYSMDGALKAVLRVKSLRSEIPLALLQRAA